MDLDLERLGQIRQVMGIELSELVGNMLDSMRVAIEQAELAVADGELDQAAKAAHSCRNDALLLGARQLLVILSELERSAREGDRVRTGRALDGLREVWPPTRDELVRIASDR
jgi:HPt (histidine-containing phosphotransfer) domain-containing protein